MESTTINFFGYDLVQVIQTGGLLVLCGIVFAETGLFVGCFLPGDSLLVAAGFVASMFPDKLSIAHVLIAVPLAAVCGDQLNYYIGRTAGAALYKRESTRFFRRDHLLQTRDLVAKYGPAALIMARFVPFARSFAPAVVGIAEMPYRKFVGYSVAGGLLWVWSMSLMGFFFGKIPFVRQHIEKAILVVIFVSVMPVFIHWLKARRAAKAAAAADAAGPGTVSE